MACSFEELCLDAIDNTWWGVLIEILITYLAFVALAMVCDQFMVQSLETLCVRWHVREDVAGASFMAFGSAAPEIVINTVTTVKSVMAANNNSDSNDADLGVSSIIGSGMIAFLLIPGACAIFAEDVLILKRRPLIRDIVFYLLSLVCLCWFFQDSRIDLQEATILVSLYFVYIVVLVVSPKIRLYMKKKRYAARGETLLPQKSFVLLGKENDDDEEEHGEKDGIQEEKDTSFLMKVVDLTGVPFKWMFEHTMPDVSLGAKHENYYFLTFVISMIWTAFFSFVISATVTRWAVISGGSMAFFGLTLVAIGAQIPDSVSSISTAKRGYGSMAVSNSLGSQITNILIGMGLPWMCASLAGHDVSITEHHLILMSSYILTAGAVLLTIVTLGVALVFRANKALLGKGKGWLLVVAYFVSIAAYGVILFKGL